MISVRKACSKEENTFVVKNCLYLLKELNIKNNFLKSEKELESIFNGLITSLKISNSIDYYIVYSSENMIGSFTVRPLAGKSEFKHSDSQVMLENMFILREFRSKGYGVEAIKQFTKLFRRENGRTVLRIEVDVSNKKGRKFWKDLLGFKENRIIMFKEI